MEGDVWGRGSLVLEFFGPPGSGKTTVTEHLSELLEPGGQIHTRRQLLSRASAIGGWRTASAFTKGGPTTWWLLDDVLRQPALNGSLKDRLGLMSRAMKYLLSVQDAHSRDQTNFILLDQWLVRFLASALSQSRISRSQMKLIIDIYCDRCNPVFAHLDADRDLLVERIMRRSAERNKGRGDGWRSQLDHLSRKEISEQIGRSQDANDVAHELLSELGASVVVLDARRTLVELSDTIKIILSDEGEHRESHCGN